MKYLFIIPPIVNRRYQKYITRITNDAITFFNTSNLDIELIAWEKLIFVENLDSFFNNYHKIIIHPNIIKDIVNVLKKDYSAKLLLILQQENIFIRKKSVQNAFTEMEVLLNNVGGVLYIDDEFRDPTNHSFRLVSKLNEYKITNDKIILKNERIKRKDDGYEL